jgi:hypothetical protein
MITAVISEQNVDLLWFHDNADILSNKLQIIFNNALYMLLPYNKEKNQLCKPFIECGDSKKIDELYNELYTYKWTDQKVTTIKELEKKVKEEDKKDDTREYNEDRYAKRDKCKYLDKKDEDEYVVL